MVEIFAIPLAPVAVILIMAEIAIELLPATGFHFVLVSDTGRTCDLPLGLFNNLTWIKLPAVCHDLPLICA